MTVSATAKRGLAGWSTRDVLVTAVLGVAFGVLLIPATYLLVALMPLGPLMQRALSALWFVPTFFVAYVVRRPGAALLTGLIAGLVLVPFTPYGVAYAIAGLMYGLCSEIGLALISRYRGWTLQRLLGAGLVTGVAFTAISAVLEQSFNFELWLVVAAVIVSVVSIALGAVLAKLLADAVARTGVLSSTALGRAGASEV